MKILAYYRAIKAFVRLTYLIAIGIILEVMLVCILIMDLSCI